MHASYVEIPKHCINFKVSAQRYQNFVITQPVNYKIQNSAQMLSLFPLLHTESVYFPSPYHIHFPTLHLAAGALLQEGQAGTALEYSEL
jgi:hypothetical protein